jgi:DeoR/GlpR family transcriptional regulator of sugar metabolism
MIRAEREQMIIHHLRAQRIVRLADFTALLDVSENTIRRDLQRLEEVGILKRTHGGAILAEDSRDSRGADDFDWMARTKLMPAEKERIGRRAAEMVRDGDSIMLDAGTTTIQVARNLHARRDLTVVTNAVNIGLELSGAASITVILTGGMLREVSKSLVGPLAEEFLAASIHVDRLFLSARGASLEAGLTNANTVEVAIKRAMIRAAKEVVLVVTHDKLGARSFTQIAPVEAVHTIVTDSGADPSQVAAFEARGIRVLLA